MLELINAGGLIAYTHNKIGSGRKSG